MKAYSTPINNPVAYLLYTNGIPKMQWLGSSSVEESRQSEIQ